MTIRYKVNASEIDGLERAYRKQVPLEAANIFLDIPETTLTNVSDSLSELYNTSAEDHHAGWFCIESGKTVIISSLKQMRVKGPFKVDGIIQIDGQLIVD